MGTCSINKKDCPYNEKGDCVWEDADKPKTVAVDLDGTILRYNGWKGHKHFGEPIDGAKEALEEFRKMGFKIIIWTTRPDKRSIQEVLRKHNIPYDYINENPYQPPDVSNKIYADFYIDDRAIEFTTWKATLKRVKDRI